MRFVGQVLIVVGVFAAGFLAGSWPGAVWQVPMHDLIGQVPYDWPGYGRADA